MVAALGTVPGHLRWHATCTAATALTALLCWDLPALGADPDATRFFADCPGCPRMVMVSAGRFVMGVAVDEEDREDLAEPFRRRSQPRREVAVAGFALGATEVTRGQYRAFADATGHRGEGCFVWSGGAFEVDARRSWRDPGFSQTDEHPAVCVSWQDASAYIDWLSARTGRRYRLPSEAEWEYAARAGTSTIRFWGDEPSAACAYANGADRTTRAVLPGAVDGSGHGCSDAYAATAPAGSFRPNAFGLHDMLGNAAEWTQDCWNADHAQAAPDARPRLEGECAMRVVRGGAWDEGPAGLRSAYRVGSPTVIRVYGRGFRVARDP